MQKADEPVSWDDPEQVLADFEVGVEMLALCAYGLLSSLDGANEASAHQQVMAALERRLEAMRQEFAEEQANGAKAKDVHVQDQG